VFQLRQANRGEQLLHGIYHFLFPPLCEKTFYQGETRAATKA
jgi:hypothetical protein